MSQQAVISVNNVSKAYTIWRDPAARLKHPLFKLFGEMIPPLRKKIDAKLPEFCSEFYALKNLSFEIKKGESIGIIGKNGSGKSTLLQIIAGTLQPSSGAVTVKGRVAALLELGSGFNPEFTGRENVYLNASILGLTRQETDLRFNEIEEFANIGDFMDQPVKTYSSGMAVRLAFAVMAHVDADILIIDEALSVGDIFFQQKCMRFIREFIKEHTLIFVSHDIAAVKSICNRAVLLEKGEIIKKGTPKEIAELYLETCYEQQQETRVAVPVAASTTVEKRDEHSLKDARLEWLNRTNLRNDLQIFQFHGETASFGKRKASIIHVALLNEQREPLSWILGGEIVILQIVAECHQELENPIVGFMVKDKLGQELFGDNTFLTYLDVAPRFEKGEVFEAQFTFRMPLLRSGDYTINAALATGTQEHHVQQHWIHDALAIKSGTSSVATGIVGISMLDIKIQQSHH